MKLLILGATGGVGSNLAAQALEAGHDVSVLVRDPTRLHADQARVNAITGDATDPDALARALRGRDAVLSGLGVGKSLKGAVVSRATAALIPVMQSAGVRRFIMCSAFGVGETFSQASLVQKFFFITLLRALYADKAKAETMLRSSALDWTIVYPVLLTNGPRTGRYRAAAELPMKGMSKISRADVAHFMLAQLSTDAWIRRGVVVSD